MLVRTQDCEERIALKKFDAIVTYKLVLIWYNYTLYTVYEELKLNVTILR